jgi:subtilisin family serine protease
VTGSAHRRGSWRRKAVAAAAAVGSALLLATVPPGSVDAAPAGPTSATYLIRMASEPVATYDGGVAGLAPTAPARGHKIDPQAPQVTDYVRHLRTRHDSALDRIGGGRKLYDYAFSFDGFAAQLTPRQAAQVAALPEVVSVTKDELRHTDTSSTPGFLGLDAPGGLWAQLGGPEGTKQRDGAGEDVVIGVVDSGIWPASKSFDDRDARGRLVYQPNGGFHGRCESAEKVGDDSWDTDLCGKKLVGARHFNAAWGGDDGVRAQRPWEFLSPRDYNGHGTHTAATAGGNHGVTPTGATTLGTVSGVAPRARIAAYKALWSTENGSTASGFTSDIVAAIDQAVADGVDVINLSISGTSTDFLDPAEIAFMYAADAGVFVAAAGGNTGPASRSVAHPSPWITTVAAGTHNRTVNGVVKLGNGETHTGASLAEGTKQAPLIDAAAAAAPGVESWQAGLCYPASANGGTPVLDPARVHGAIVVCDDGNIAGSAKSRAVAEAGGVGVILAETGSSAPVAEVNLVPTVNVDQADGTAIKAYAATTGATATIGRATVDTSAPAPNAASFSSRGPLFAGGGDLLKPDVMAPGQNILAAIAPPANDGLDFKVASGTSMATPHVAGLAALLRQQHPDWSPMTIKSALMTTGYDIRDGRPTDPSVIFAQGAGHVRPNGAADPGLAYDSDADDWIAFLCGTTRGVVPQVCAQLADEGHSLDPNDLNTPSIAIGRMSGQETVTREVTNVGARRATYTAEVAGLDDLEVTVSPARLTIDPGQTKEFSVRIAPGTAEPNRYYGGQLTWKDGTHTVRAPIVARLTPPAVDGWRVDTVAGGPTFDMTTQSGYVRPELPVRPGKTAGDGVGVGAVMRFGGDGGEGKRVVRFGVDGWHELGGLGTDTEGNMLSYVFATTPDGTAVGNAAEYDEDGVDLGNRPVRWDTGSTEATELEGLGTDADGRSYGAANVVNQDGTAAGDVTQYAADGTDLGRRAVRWEAGRTEATLLGHLGADGYTNAWTRAINSDGTIVGNGQKRDGSGNYLGGRAIRWDAGSTEATELDSLGTDARGSSSAEALDINDAGTTVGQATPYVDGQARGAAAVRWDAGDRAATRLDSLDTSEDGFQSSHAYAINDGGDIVGTSTAYGPDGTGTRAVRWAAGGTGVTELEQLEVSPTGEARSTALDVNDDGVAVGTAFAFSESGPYDPGDRAVAWTTEGDLVDLTALLPADSGWTLSRAVSVSDTGWITGVGLYDPDGAGGVEAYERMFLLRLTSA